ncbi:DUF7344 domain-containing protein [Natrinema limicola]|uniref:DUF7344 domain-containing protein n=1 Tax=Natrinema limicola JCM 13563 TaxID=1230457 RepID=M0CPX6_9EURY|nr:hypothetical protein [Natrinema limicola]ELZ23924.1 hypothetical protein C476_04225 [Natrinema limicola JCM 13563]
MGDESFEPDLRALRAAADELPFDDVVRLLGDRHARPVLVYLHDHPAPTLEELADVVAAADASETGTIAAPSDRDRIRLRLYHSILPRLEDLGFITFDTAAKTVTDTDIPESVSAALGETDSEP